ncbi:unnamed protein product [Caenorhabditis nigoni]
MTSKQKQLLKANGNKLINRLFIQYYWRFQQSFLNREQVLSEYAESSKRTRAKKSWIRVVKNVARLRAATSILAAAHKNHTFFNRTLLAFALAKEFIDLIGGACQKHVAFTIRALSRDIWAASKFDKQTRIKMLFVMAETLHEHTLAELREDATVDVDDERRITYYSAKDGSLKLEGKPKEKVSRRAKPQAKRSNLEDSEPEIPVKRRRESTPLARLHLDSTSELSDDEPPRKPKS